MVENHMYPRLSRTISLTKLSANPSFTLTEWKKKEVARQVKTGAQANHNVMERSVFTVFYVLSNKYRKKMAMASQQ